MYTLPPRPLSLRLRRPLDPPLSVHVQVIRPYELKVRIVLHGSVLRQAELVSPHQLGQKDFDLLQREVEADAHARPRGEGRVRPGRSLFHGVRVPAVRVEAARVVPDGLVVVQVVQGGYDDGTLRQAVTPREDHVDFRGAGGLVGGVVPALRLLDEVVEEGQLRGEFGGDLGVGGPAVVDELLEEALLVARVGDEAVDEPGEEGGGGGEAGAGGDEEGGGELGGGQLVAFAVGCAEEVV